MKPLDVYQRYPIAFVSASGSQMTDRDGQTYLDLYGGHGVISIGHSHPHFVAKVGDALQRLAFYSNSVEMPEQQNLCNTFASLLKGDAIDYSDYNLFLVNSGAEANENAMKLAAMATGRKNFLAFSGGFHGRTALVAAATDGKYVKSPVTDLPNIKIIAFNDEKALEENINSEVAGVIIEGIQGVGGIQEPSTTWWQILRSLCSKHGAMLIADEIQSGCGRSGRFFAHQHHHVQAEIVSMAKGIGNGFPVGAVISSPAISAAKGSLGTTFGGSYMACAAMQAVLEILTQERLLNHAAEIGQYTIEQLKKLPGIKQVRGRGLFIGIDTEKDAKSIRSQLLMEHRILTGFSDGTQTIRVIPPLNIARQQVDDFLQKLASAL